MNTPIRRLDGITYWVIEDSSAIYDFINTNVRREWEGDSKSEDRDPSFYPFLRNLGEYRWSLQVVPTRLITPDPDTMNYVNERSGYVFSEALSKRSDALETSIRKYDSVISPVVVIKESYLLKDGFCRFTTLQRMKIPEVYAYVGER